MMLTKNKCFEPIHQSRWILRFKDYDIPEFTVMKISNLKHSNINGIMKWEKITITLHDIISISNTKTIVENLVDIPKIVIEKLDPIGVCVETITICSNEMHVDFGKFDYKSDKLNRIKIRLSPTKVIVSQ
jgi:hypothetical protein